MGSGVLSGGALGGADAASVAAAMAACEAITRREAKNFAYGIRLLRRPERQALSAVYALARRIDDIGDAPTAADERLRGLDEVRAAVERLAAGSVPPADDPVLVAVAAAAGRFPLPLGAFVELVQGCRRDVEGFRYATMDDLVGYCRLVAGTVGRLTVGVLGVEDPAVLALADDLGVALQLTNILRDVEEDRAMGRVYLPADRLVSGGLTADLEGPASALAAVVASVGVEAEGWYDRGLELLPGLDRRGQACVAALAGIYRRLLARILADPLAVTRGRVALSTSAKLQVALTALARAAWHRSGAGRAASTPSGHQPGEDGPR
jgi:phytoene synthase